MSPSADAPQHLRGRTKRSLRSRTTPLGRRSGIPMTGVPTPRGGAMSSTPTSSPTRAAPQRLSRAVATDWSPQHLVSIDCLRRALGVPKLPATHGQSRAQAVVHAPLNQAVRRSVLPASGWFPS